MSCDKSLLVQADFDGELDAAEAAALAAHRENCPDCAAVAATLDAARAALVGDLYRPAPAALRQALAARLAPARGPKWRSWRMVGSFGLGAALAASLAIALLPRSGEDIAGQVLASHIRALQPGHLEDVLSTDRHTVKPWFDGRLDFAPPVKDLAADGFPLEGGRLDYLGGRAVAALVYEHGGHPINLYAWPSRGADSLPDVTGRQGYTLMRWRQGNMALWVVSDLERAELEDFVRRWRAAG